MWRKSTKTYGLGRLKAGEMNKTEKAYSEYLKQQMLIGEIVWYAFEGIKFKLAKDLHFSPDFSVMLPDGTIEIREVKGSLSFIQDDAKAKIKTAAAMFPFRFLLVAPIAKKNGGGWEMKEVG